MGSEGRSKGVICGRKGGTPRHPGGWGGHGSSPGRRARPVVKTAPNLVGIKKKRAIDTPRNGKPHGGEGTAGAG